MRKPRYIPLSQIRDLQYYPESREGFPPALAESVIRHAVVLHERKTGGLAVDELKRTLAEMGVSPDAVERAAAEVRKDLQTAPKVLKPSDVIMPVVSFFILVAPGVALMVWARDIPLLPWWLALPIGGLWTFSMVTTSFEDLRKWWRARRLHSGG